MHKIVTQNLWIPFGCEITGWFVFVFASVLCSRTIFYSKKKKEKESIYWLLFSYIENRLNSGDNFVTEFLFWRKLSRHIFKEMNE